MAFLTGNAAPDGAVPELSFEYELIMIILNDGHTDTVMDAARSAGAAGGTVLHAKGTGAKQAERFLGVSIAEEKELIIIVSKAAEKAAPKKASKTAKAEKAEEKAPAKRGRKPKAEAAPAEEKAPAKRGRKPKTEAAPAEEKAPAKRGRKPKAEKAAEPAEKPARKPRAKKADKAEK